ncbi:DUF3861 domain-containing protein [Allomuricauda sp. NBRC 101325]|uniref:DUF3861 domain-containing protein n=1 Tax=Allomuricauda sp. NBRC 101325 TaxID=1113758 RepID=UPI0024A2026A|nr:DUF3861 domain-containing protein [Muricauda sp. NBRC 101325]GLU44382.1 hypothetical protein Musp01_20060 [Muricauda sp. NBRC 101325]
MTKRNNSYKIQLEELTLKDGSSPEGTLEFEFQNHDNILDLVDLIKDKALFQDKNENIEFLIGLKLFSEVMLRNKNNPMFEDMLPEFGKFMKKFKSQVKMAETA